MSIRDTILQAIGRGTILAISGTALLLFGASIYRVGMKDGRKSTITEMNTHLNATLKDKKLEEEP